MYTWHKWEYTQKDLEEDLEQGCMDRPFDYYLNIHRQMYFKMKGYDLAFFSNEGWEDDNGEITYAKMDMSVDFFACVFEEDDPDIYSIFIATPEYCAAFITGVEQYWQDEFSDLLRKVDESIKDELEDILGHSFCFFS